MGINLLFHILGFLDKVNGFTRLMDDALYQLSSESFQWGYCLYELVTHHVILYREAIFDDPIPHSLAVSFPSLLSSDDYPHVSMEHTSSSLA
jgi:hypothetical protein